MDVWGLRMSAAKIGVRVVAQEIVTALGVGTEACWLGLVEKRCALVPDSRFYPSDPAQCYPVGVVRECDGAPLSPAAGESRFMRLLSILLPSLRRVIPDDARVILSTTVGETDLLERELLAGKSGGAGGDLHVTLARVREALGSKQPALLLSAACASSTSALALGAEWVASGRFNCVCVIGCDALSEFVYSGFLSLQALSRRAAQPFHPGRDGLNLGEAAGYALLMSEARARAEKRPNLGTVEGWGQGCDAAHMTTPAQDGAGLVRAVTRALDVAAMRPEKIGAICAHGTGTPFNDDMEETAFLSIFGNVPPLFGVKGAIGHTLGAAGVVEMCLTLRALRARRTPPTVGAERLPSQALRSDYALTTNSGFGGINVALLLRRGED